MSNEVQYIIKKYPFGFSCVGRRLRKHFYIACIKAHITHLRFHDLRACAITNFMLPPFNFTIAQTAVISGHKSWDELKRYERIKAEQLVDTFKRLKK